VGAQKLVPDPEAARERIFQHSLPLEDARAYAAYGQNSVVGKILEIHQETPGRIQVVLIHRSSASDAHSTPPDAAASERPSKLQNPTSGHLAIARWKVARRGAQSVCYGGLFQAPLAGRPGRCGAGWASDSSGMACASWWREAILSLANTLRRW
jgi:hypothetical protein